MVWASAAYTILTLEETQRNANRALLTSLSSRQRDCLSALIRFAAYVPQCVKKKQVSLPKVIVFSLICIYICMYAYIFVFFLRYYFLIHALSSTGY